MTRAIFMQGQSPYEYIPALNIALFLSGDKEDVEAAIKAGHPAGQMLNSKFDDDENDHTLRIAFDFDGVLAGDESEAVMQIVGKLMHGKVDADPVGAGLPAIAVVNSPTYSRVNPLPQGPS